MQPRRLPQGVVPAQAESREKEKSNAADKPHNRQRAGVVPAVWNYSRATQVATGQRLHPAREDRVDARDSQAGAGLLRQGGDIPDGHRERCPPTPEDRGGSRGPQGHTRAAPDHLRIHQRSSQSRLTSGTYHRPQARDRLGPCAFINHSKLYFYPKNAKILLVGLPPSVLLFK